MRVTLQPRKQKRSADGTFNGMGRGGGSQTPGGVMENRTFVPQFIFQSPVQGLYKVNTRLPIQPGLPQVAKNCQDRTKH